MSTEPAHRARSMAEMGSMQAGMMPFDDVVASIKAYSPRATDIIISPFGKCGTTWLQQTFHTLRTRGDMAFDDISRVVPWIETARALSLDINAAQRAEPRGFKSHLPYDAMPKGAKYVVSLRNPKDQLVSMYRFMEGWWLQPGTVSITEFAQANLARLGEGHHYLHHLVSWWQQRDNPNVLLISYEHMTADPVTSLRKLADFCGIALDDALLALALERSSLSYMLQYKDRFDDAMMRKLSERTCNLPAGSDSAKVRKGGVAMLPRSVRPSGSARYARHREIVGQLSTRIPLHTFLSTHPGVHDERAHEFLAAGAGPAAR